MPTNLCARKLVQREPGGESSQALAMFYAAIILFGLLLFTVEARLGLSDGMTLAQAPNTATAANLPAGNSAEPWTPVAP